MVVVELDAELEAAIRKVAVSYDASPEAMALNVLRQRFLRKPVVPLIPRDDWERELLAIAVDCGVSLPDSAITSEALYD